MRRRVFLVLGLMFMVSAPARADTDYRCLTQCVDSGLGSQPCLVRCTYVKAKAVPDANTVVGHNQFAAPQPSDGTLIAAPLPKTAAAQEDYQCLAACEKDGEQVVLCQRQCAVSLSKGGYVSAANPGNSVGTALPVRPQ